MIIKVKPYILELKHSFNISYSSRKFTNVVLIKIHNENIFGFGEASLPPYYPETVITVLEFINKIRLKDINNIEQLINQLKEIDEIEDGNFAAKAAIDIALHDYLGKKLGLPIHKLYGIEPFDFPNTSFTIGLDSPEILKEKISEADKFKILKIKLGSEDDKRIIELIRDLTDKPLYVDINQGWGSKEYSLDMINGSDFLPSIEI